MDVLTYESEKSWWNIYFFKKLYFKRRCLYTNLRIDLNYSSWRKYCREEILARLFWPVLHAISVQGGRPTLSLLGSNWADDNLKKQLEFNHLDNVQECYLPGCLVFSGPNLSMIHPAQEMQNCANLLFCNYLGYSVGWNT